MKKYIAIIIFLAGFLLSYYSGYSTTISEMQYNQIQSAIKNDNYEYFLKFNTKYELQSEVNHENVLINKLYLSEYDKVGYNLIIVGLNEDLFNQTSKEDNTKIVLSGSKGDYEIPYYANMYISSGIINIQLEKNSIIDETGEVLTNLQLYNPNDEKILDVTLNIDTSTLTKEYMENQLEGYTSEEIKELMHITSYTPLLKQVGFYLIATIIIISIYFIALLIYRKVAFRQKSSI